MALPKQVQDGIDRANALSAELQAAEPTIEGEDTSVPVQADNPQEQNVDTQVVEEIPIKEEVKPEVDEDFKQKYKTLKGKFDAEVPRLQQTISGLNAEVAGLVKRNTSLMGEVDSYKSEVKPLNPDDYGVDGADLVNVINQLKHDNELLKKQFEGTAATQAKSTQTNFMDGLRSHVDSLGHSLDEVNENTGFMNWLREAPEYGTETKQDILNKAVQSCDVNVAKKLFGDWIKLNGSTKKKVMPNVQPSANANTSVNSQPKGKEKKIWTRAEVKSFYQSKANGTFRGSKADAKKLEASLFEATNLGLIRD